MVGGAAGGGDVVSRVLCGVRGGSSEVGDGLCCCEADTVWETSE